jgi:O-methyltransferase
MVTSIFKYLLTLIGTRLSLNDFHKLQLVLNYMRIGKWMKDHYFYFSKRVVLRDQVFESVADNIQNRRVLYCEFGVYKGESILYWAQKLQHPDSHLHGFDSFEGLPEDFDIGGPYKKGAFDVSGRMPNIEDPRVRFFKGWFNEVLPTYVPPDHDILVLMLDADLYSSTIYVLRYFKSFIRKGTYIYFDEMSRPEHEPKAFHEFMEETGFVFQPVCSDYGLNRVFFQCV